MKKNIRIGLISAVKPEAGRLIRLLGSADPAVKAPLKFYRGNIYGCDVVYVTSGIGKVNAAHAATMMISRYSPSVILNFGIGGAYPSAGLEVGDVATASKEVNVDEGVWLGGGLATFDQVGLPILKKGQRTWFNEYSLAGRSLKKTVAGLLLTGKETFRSFRVVEGPFATVSACTGTDRRAREIEERFKVICENMEGAAVAQVCSIYGIPAIEIRGISNIVEDRDRGKWDMADAAGNCQAVVIEMLRLLGR